ncbi:YgaP family membrane protein [Rossellomorea vietnamensis]|uniref:YgaP family membrane protein n=1 Tax=Rossellomorea vietnamensis TaxID=218284 RepID=UPI003D271BEB
MKVSSNIGIINALIRITVGFTILAWSTSKLARRPWRDSYLVMAVIGAMKVGEGILRYCPVTALFEKGGDGEGKNGGFGGFKVKDMMNFKDMLKSDKSSHSEHQQTTEHHQDPTNTKKEANFNPEELTNQEVQEALTGSKGTDLQS